MNAPDGYDAPTSHPESGTKLVSGHRGRCRAPRSAISRSTDLDAAQWWGQQEGPAMQRNDTMRNYAHARRRVVVVDARLPIARRLLEQPDTTATLKASLAERSATKKPKRR